VLVDVPVISMLFGEKTEAYLRINHHRIAFGASFSLGGTFKLKTILEATLRKGASLHGYMGRDPLLIRGKLDVMGELGLKAFEKFEFKLTGHVTVVVHLPTPVLFRIALPYKLDLPWPLPDIEDSILELGDDEIVAPAISSPLLTGSFTVGGSPTIQDRNIAAITASHTVSERHWMPGVDKLWPDLELVVPFSRQVTDTTSSVVGLVVTASIVSIPGSYDVKEELTKLEILDLVHNTVVPDVKAVWVDGPDGNTSLLHVLGSDPFSWLTSQTSTANLGSSTPAKIRDVFFGFGPPETFGLPRRFDDMFVTPLTDPAKLVTEFQLHLVTRGLRTKEVKMSFMSGGDEIAVDQVTLLLIGFNKRDKLVIGPGNVEVSLTDGDPIVGGVHFVIATFTFPTPRTHFTVRTQHGEQFLVYSVRYREAAQKADVTWKKTLLKPGRYRLTVEGKSTAEHPEFNNVHPEIYPSAPPIDWWATQDFEVVYPETLHPYIFYSTFGDNRRFSRDQHPWTTWTADTWDPALFGFGLPLYRQYHLVVRFLVPYVGAMFDDAPLKVRIVYDKGGEIVYTVVATPAPDGSSSMLPESTTWITAMGGMVSADQELVVPQLLPAPSDPAGAGGLNPGSARLTISFNHPGGGELPVEDWTGLVSRFNNFREHLAWNGTCLTTFYDKYGRHQRPACPALSWPAEKSGLDLFFAGGIEPLVVAGRLSKPPKPSSAVGALLVEPTETGPMIAYPPELTSAPLDWILPPALFEQLGGLDNSAGLRFGRFAAATGVRFNAGSGDALSGMSDTVGATTIEAVIDSLGRPYALWVRTPEPVDWRRVTATLSIRHVEPEKKVPQFVQPGKPGDDCPTSYVHRSPLELAVSVLPSPDGSSVFLVGDFAGSKIVLPRGEFTLMLKFDPAKAGLPPLRPSTLVGPGSEMVTLRFLQPLGKTWPLASDDLVIPNYVVQTAMRYLKFPPALLIEAYQKQLSAEEFERRIRAHLQSIDAAVTAPEAEALETLESHAPQRGKA
jgi:hypothetical protein